MKIKWNTNRIINVVVVCSITITAILYIFSTKDADKIFAGDVSSALEIRSSIDENITDSLNYRRLIEKRDSIKWMRFLKNGDIYNSGDIKFGNLMGTSQARYCDTCSLKWLTGFTNVDEAHRQYYIDLNGWGLSNSDYAYLQNKFVEFYVKNGKSYVRKDSIETPVKFRYNHRDRCIMIPVSKSTEQWVTIGLIAFAVIFVLYNVFLLICFAKFLVDISRGDVFTDTNLRRLLIIAVTYLAVPFLMVLANLLIRLIFHSYFTPDVILNENVWKDSWQGIATGIVFLLLYKAFRQGKKLKDEHDLTV